MAQRAVALKPAGHILDTLGWVYYNLGRFEEARKAIEEALRLLNDDPVIYEHLGDILLALGKPAAARTAYQKSLELEPDNPSVKDKLQLMGKPE